MKHKKSRGKKKINKKRLLFVIIVIMSLVFGISKLFIGVKNMMQSRHMTEQRIDNGQNAEAYKGKIITIFIDPAKGGINQGFSTPDGSLKEKDITLDIGKRVKANLERHDDVKVFMSREYDENKSIEDRVRMANEKEADIVVSIRINAQSNSGEAEGLDTYYSALEGKKKLKNENDGKENSKEIISSIRKKDKSIQGTDEKGSKELSQRKNLSEKLANSIQSTTLSFINMKDRGIVGKNFDVLTYTKMPSVIIQCGFISNKSDGEKLQNDKYRQDIADGIGDGILNFIDGYRDDLINDRVNYR